MNEVIAYLYTPVDPELIYATKAMCWLALCVIGLMFIEQLALTVYDNYYGPSSITTHVSDDDYLACEKSFADWYSDDDHYGRYLFETNNDQCYDTWLELEYEDYLLTCKLLPGAVA